VGRKDWIENLTHQDRLRVEFTARKGGVIEIGLIQYEAEIEGQWKPLVRYDMAHGFFHRDILKPDGTQEKLEIPYTDLAEALTTALEEIHCQWEFYRQAYEERRRK